MNTHRLLPWLVGAGVAALVLCCGGTGLMGLAWLGLQPDTTTQRATVESDRQTAPVQRQPQPETNPDREEFARFVRENAQDPAGLEIITWGEKQNNKREVRFRCKLIAITPAGTFFPGAQEKGGDPVLLDDAQIYYAADGTIQRVHLDRSHLFWNAKSRQ